MWMLISLFVNHDQNRIYVDEPLILNLSLIFVFIILILITLRTKIEDKPLSVLQTNQMKGVAIIAVLLDHLFAHTIEVSGKVPGFYKNGYAGVALFLILSGFGLCISMKKKGLENFFSKRVIRVLIPLVCAIGIEIFLNHLILHQQSNLFFDFTKILFNLSSLDRNMWFVVFILFWYCIIYFVFLLNLSNKGKLIFLCSISLLILTIPQIPPPWKINALSFPVGCYLGLNAQLVIEKINDLLNQNIMILILILMVIFTIATLPKLAFISLIILLLSAYGIYKIYICYKNKNLELKISPENLALYLTVIIVLCHYLGWVFNDSIVGNHNIFNSTSRNLLGIFIATGICLFISLLIKLNKYSNFLNWIGDFSYELYLIHGMFMYSFDFILFRGNIAITFFIYFLLICIFSLCLKQVSSNLSDLLLKRVKA